MGLCLTVAAAGLLACSDEPTRAPESVSATTGVAPSDSVRLTYICGNMFRVRNSAFEPRRVRWEVFNASPAATGSFVARGRDVGASHVDLFFTARTRGTVRLFVGGRLVDTKANGGRAACAEPADATPLPQATGAIVRYPASDPTIALGDSTIVSRTVVMVRFAEPSNTALARRFQRAFDAQFIAAVGNGLFVARVHDLGATTTELAARLAAMRAAEGVRHVLLQPVLGRPAIDGAIYPSEGGQLTRQALLNRDPEWWAVTALRLSQAWWCKTGQYAARVSLSRGAVFEHSCTSASIPGMARWCETEACLGDGTHVAVQEASVPTTVSGSVLTSITDSVRLTYICGSMFRVRNGAFEPRRVRWEVLNAVPADTGSFVARGRDVGASHVDLFFTSRTRGTARLFVDARLVGSMANGDRAACAEPRDTTRVASVRSAYSVDALLQPQFVDSAGAHVARNLLFIQWNTVSGALQRDLLRALNAQVVSTSPSFVRVRIPVPDSTRQALDSVLRRARGHAAVRHATFVTSLDGVHALGEGKRALKAGARSSSTRRASWIRHCRTQRPVMPGVVSPDPCPAAQPRA